MTRPAVLLAGTTILSAFNIFASPFGFPSLNSPSLKTLQCKPDSFARILPPGATLEKVEVVPEGGSYGEGAANVAYPTNPTNLPALCTVTVRVRSSRTSSYRFGLFLPKEWNSRFFVVGNGGFAGGINWQDMASGARHGMASLSTDTGHNSTGIDASWGLNQPEKRTDWGWRAIHGSTILGKKLVQAYYGGKAIRYSYFSGCSNGGRQGLKEIQNFPNSFDGVLIGAPAWWFARLTSYFTYVGMRNLPATDPKHLTAGDISLLAAEVVRQCDSADGVRDGIVSSPELCAFDFTALLCTTATTNQTNCLNPSQLTTAQAVYNDYLSSTDSSVLHPGFPLGSENELPNVLPELEPTAFGVGYQRYFLFDDPSWDWRTFNESVVAYADRIDPGDTTADDYAGVGAFARRGGKLLVYHGLSDGLISAHGSALYYNRTVDALGGEGVDGFFGMFLVPGMLHCGDTAVDAPWSFGAASQAAVMGSGAWSVPGFEDRDHDAVMALVDWVERGRKVDQIIATTWNSPLDPASGVRRQRPICPWPKKAVYDGVGDVDQAESWKCA
ncbi:hypothetical protein MFIFM68171_07662 [Madurella fahalii]|uniref:Carboxylic ester hydrolase n=1 Tax=Madurella fahalii TaxID=1157608 RepID=A0ABQ0GI63_9PEZI